MVKVNITYRLPSLVPLSPAPLPRSSSSFNPASSSRRVATTPPPPASITLSSGLPFRLPPFPSPSPTSSSCPCFQMLSVFNVNKRNKSQKAKKLSSKPPLKRVQSPPSPASFASPEIVEINDHGPFGGSFPEVRPPASSTERPAVAVSSPQLQLDFDSSEPLFPPTILPPPGSLTPPKRNVSLPNAGRNASDPSSARARGATPDELTIREEPLQPNRLQVDTSVQNARMSADVSESSTAPSSRKPTPSPIKIPNNSTSAKIKVQSSADGSANTNTSVPPPLPSKNSGPPSPTSALTDDISSAISGTSLARAFATSFILSNESRASKYKSGITRQDSATLPRGEHPLNSSPYGRERRASSGDPGSARSSSVPPVPQLPSRAELGLSMDNTSLDKSQRNSVALVLESGESNQLVPPLTLKRSMSTGRLRREQSTSMPPISPISEASSPAPSVPETPGAVNPNTSVVSNASSRSLATSLAQQKAPNLSEATASSSSLGTDASGHHARAATEPAGSISTAGDRRPSNATKPKGPLVLDRTGSAMPGTMRSSGAFAINNSRLTVTRTISESGSTRSGMGGASRPAVLLPIGERPSSVLVPPSPQPSIGAPTPTSARVGGSNVSTVETPVDSPDLLDNFPVQIARERSAGPPPPLPLGRRSEDNVSIPTPLHSSSGESVSSTNRQTFPETPNAFSPLWSGTFNSPPTSRSPSSPHPRTQRRSDPPPPPPPPLHVPAGVAESSEQSNRSSVYSSTLHLQASSSQSSIPQKRSLSPLPSPPPSSVPMPPSPGRSRLDAHASSISVEQPPPPYMDDGAWGTPPVPPPPSPGLPPPPTPPPSNTRLTNYKLLVRRRNAALAHLARLAEGVEHAEPSTAGRVADELSELNESLDLTAEELYTVTDQLGQLARLRDLHQRSALAMALRKLNNSFLKQVGEVQRLRDLVETLEAEREEAWQEAQEVAQEFDDFTDRIMVDPASSSSAKDVTPSRRSSRVLLARKNSQRASKSGLRSSMYRRSHRSSTSSSHRYSGAASPGAWQPPGGGEDIPPVPPIPSRRDLIRFPSGDLPTRSSMDSPSSELRAMVQAQKELCEMLGISLEELKVHQPSRRQSMSALPGARSPASQAPTRRNSDIITPNRRSF
ncbi:hypothetical protein BN946_scf184857.g46 [Trametes cinnabarina]|uniref:Uncharacterized protein n=1 Tax=Pycnoporus cinnabarinus TaxID=5643 RepID=A0A060SYV8_PYCCI|nr:hypothetical protein BN946_scf184857.g46 [Trametes cinnabarina]